MFVLVINRHSDICKSSAAVKNGENKTFMTTGTLIVGVILFEAIQYCCKYRYSSISMFVYACASRERRKIGDLIKTRGR